MSNPNQHKSAPKRWWMSWLSEVPFTYHGPWWVSGCDHLGRYTICAAVLANTEKEARDAIASCHDEPSTKIDWRFVNERPVDWSPFCDRFPRANWMQWPYPVKP